MVLQSQQTSETFGPFDVQGDELRGCELAPAASVWDFEYPDGYGGGAVRARAAPELELHEVLDTQVVEVVEVGERPHRAGDYAFNNIGISSYFMLSSTMTVADRESKGYYAVGGCGGNIAWHTENDRLEIADRDNLMRVFREADWSESDDGTLILEKRRWDAESGRIHAAGADT